MHLLVATRVDAILALLLSPFVALLVLAAVAAVAYVIHIDSHQTGGDQ